MPRALSHNHRSPFHSDASKHPPILLDLLHRTGSLAHIVDSFTAERPSTVISLQTRLRAVSEGWFRKSGDDVKGLEK